MSVDEFRNEYEKLRLMKIKAIINEIRAFEYDDWKEHQKACYQIGAINRNIAELVSFWNNRL